MTNCASKYNADRAWPKGQRFANKSAFKHNRAPFQETGLRGQDAYAPFVMIAYLSGTVLSKQATSAIIDVGGVGYEVAIPLSTFYELGDVGAPAQLRIYTHVREDTLQLYGFKTSRERELFLHLISVNGVGPGLAIKLLSGMNADELVASIRTNNLARLVSVPGVGRKTAERLVVDLRDKIAALSSPALEEEFAVKTVAAGAGRTEDSMRSDSISALTNLGYQRSAAEKAVKNAIDEGGDLSVEVILRRSLRSLAKS
jgi:Holliday junction DNA helicase RuvA